MLANWWQRRYFCSFWLLVDSDFRLLKLRKGQWQSWDSHIWLRITVKSSQLYRHGTMGRLMNKPKQQRFQCLPNCFATMLDADKIDGLINSSSWWKLSWPDTAWTERCCWTDHSPHHCPQNRWTNSPHCFLRKAFPWSRSPLGVLNIVSGFGLIARTFLTSHVDWAVTKFSKLILLILDSLLKLRELYAQLRRQVIEEIWKFLESTENGDPPHTWF